MSVHTEVATRSSFIAPMRPFHVPALNARYWVIICIASVFGCNLGDFVSHYLHVGNWMGLFPLALIFAVLNGTGKANPDVAGA